VERDETRRDPRRDETREGWREREAQEALLWNEGSKILFVRTNVGLCVNRNLRSEFPNSVVWSLELTSFWCVCCAVKVR